MAIRRRRRKLTNLLSTLDRRVKTLEFRPIDLLSTSEQATAEALADAVDVIVSNSAPNQYLPIEKAYLYGSGVSGSKPRVEVFFGANPGTRKDDRFEISGLNGSATDDFELSGSRLTVISASEEPWDDEERKNFQYTPTDQEPELINSVMFSTNVEAPEGTTQPIELITKVEIASYEGSDSTIRINLTGQHKFKVGDVVYVELGVENPLVFGRDGLFRLTNVDPSFIEYEISSPLAEPINTTPVTTIIRRVYAVGHNFVRDGATWVDNSEATDQVFTWRDIRWVSFNEFVGDDGVAPGPVTNLAGTSESRAVDGITSSVARVTLSWTNPTTNANGNPLDDLLGVQVWHRYNESEPFEKGDVILGDDQTWTKDGFEVKRGGVAVSTVTFRVYAVDSGGLLSEPAEIDVEITPAAKQIKTPTAPQVKQYLGTPTFTWDGLQTDGTLPPLDAYEVEVHISTIDNFSVTDGTFQEGTGTFYGSFLAESGGYLVLNANDLTDGNTYYVRFVLTDIHGNKETSGQSSFTADVDKPVKFDVIDVGTLDGKLITGLQIQTGPNVNDGSGSDQNGVVLVKQGIRAYDRDGNLTFAVDSDNGTIRLLRGITLNGYLTADEVDQRIGNIDTSLDGDKLIQAINQATGGKIDGTYINEDSIVTPLLATDRFVSPGGAINSAGTIINGDNITTGSINADRISGGSIDASRITVKNLNADNLTSGTIVGRTLIGRMQTRFSTNNQNSEKKRIIISESTNTIKFFFDGDTNSNQRGTLEATGAGLKISGASGLSTITVSSGNIYLSNGNSRRANLDLTGTGFYARGAGSDRGELKLVSNYSELNCANGGAQFYLFPNRMELRKGYLQLKNWDTGGYSYTVVADSSGNIQRANSDARLKKEVTDLNLGLSLLNELRPVSFKWEPKEEEQQSDITHLGLIAQEVKDALNKHGVSEENTNLVTKFKNTRSYERVKEGEDIYGLEYNALIPVLINSIKELSKKVDDLEAKIVSND